MNSLLIKFFMILCLLSFNTFAQLHNRSFEEWGSNGPVGWKTNDTLDYKLITQSFNSHEGAYAAHGKVITINIGDYQQTLGPVLFAAGSKGNGFPFSGKPKALTGYFNFTSVGGDKFVVIVTLQRGAGNPVALGKLEVGSSTGPGYHKFKVDLHYVNNSVPTDMIIFIATSAYLTGQAHVGTEFIVDDISPVEITKPNPGDIIISGERDTINWEDGAVSSVDLDYSLNNGETYNNIITSYPDSGKYIWDVPDTLLSRYGKLRIRDHQDNTNKNEQFVIFKPWELTRINDQERGGLEPYKPNEDGWSFVNNNPPMWPQTWWKQFKYKSGGEAIDPFTGSGYPDLWPFNRAKSSWMPDWPLFVNVFGLAQCYLGKYYRGKALHKWYAIKDIKFNGTCEGFAISSILYFYHKGQLLTRFPGIGDYVNLYSASYNQYAQSAIIEYYTHQFGKPFSSDYQKKEADQTLDVRRTLQDLKNMFRLENGDAKPLILQNNNKKKKDQFHTVTPYKLERIGKTHTFNLRIYDNNYPGASNKIIFRECFTL
jgi:hypothetical protein